MGHLVPCDQAADIQQGQTAAAWVRDDALPLVPAPAVEEVDRAAADPREVLDRLLQGPVQVLVVAGVDRRPDIAGGQTVEVSASQESVDLGAGVEEMEDQPSEGWECGTMAVSKPRFIEPED